ncbi:MAG: DUF1524 domain-containing protein [Actinobacteria bacterium]|jgi:hypothetical protein|uniref:Unannotated protein n=1 Tax=freshwater metagenome TaxID=449393 RepID=A0A6J6K2I8_9ZZZZ|nr:DUF1524 domain-containing protein [Actinomycetota bacterium]
MSRWEIRLAIGLIGSLLASGMSITSQAAAFSQASEVTATSVLMMLPVKGRAAKTGYTRAQFGQTWADVDRNGCDTRNDMLKRDLTEIVFKVKTRNCVVESGVLLDRYSGETINFVRGNVTSMEVQIDHVVALSNSWQTGAFKLSVIQRTALANDPLNLFAVKGRLNSQKGDGDAATWLPPLKSFRCAYVAQQIAVKAKYSLWVTAPEKDAMERILTACPKQVLPK